MSADELGERVGRIRNTPHPFFYSMGGTRPARRTEAGARVPTTAVRHGVIHESLPERVRAALEVRDAWRQRVAESGAGLEFIVSELEKWPVAATIRVAFLGGTADLHQKIADAAQQINDAANITLDFGRTADGQFRRWSTNDRTYSAEIRISFDQDGYYSLVGTDSTDRTVGFPDDPDGGRPHQRSLNLGGFDTALPSDWKGTVRHELLHALSFNHEHQNLNGPCQADFRFEDDPGYIPTTDAFGQYVKDAAGRKPGIYTYLAGAPNRWSRATVNHNLRPVTRPGTVASGFDPQSVMLYRFDPLFYGSASSECLPSGDGINLSDGDRAGLLRLYPYDEESLAAERELAIQRLAVVRQRPEAETGLESGLEGRSVGSPFQQRVTELLEGTAGSTG